MGGTPKGREDGASSDNVICPYCRRQVHRAAYVEHTKDLHPWQMYLLDGSKPRLPIEVRSLKSAQKKRDGSDRLFSDRGLEQGYD